MSSSLVALCRKRNTLKSVPVSLMFGHLMVFNKLIVDVQSVRGVSIKRKKESYAFLSLNPLAKCKVYMQVFTKKDDLVFLFCGKYVV